MNSPQSSVNMSASKITSRTAEDWFKEAERVYTEKHQGCPWCGGSHRVFCQRSGDTLLFYCQGCDFHASHHASDNTFRMLPGIIDTDVEIPDTMFGIAKTINS